MSDDDENDFILESDSSSRLSNGSWNHNFAAQVIFIYFFESVSLRTMMRWVWRSEKWFMTPFYKLHVDQKVFRLAMDDESIACT